MTVDEIKAELYLHDYRLTELAAGGEVVLAVTEEVKRNRKARRIAAMKIREGLKACDKRDKAQAYVCLQSVERIMGGIDEFPDKNYFPM